MSGAADRTLQKWEVPCKSLSTLEGEARESKAKADADCTVAAGFLEDGGGVGGKLKEEKEGKARYAGGGSRGVRS